MAIGFQMTKLVAGAASAQALIMMFMQTASAEPNYYQRLNAENRAAFRQTVNYDRAVAAHNQAVLNAYNQAAVNQAAANAAFNRAAAINQARAINNYNRAAAYNQAAAMAAFNRPVYPAVAYNPFYRPSVFTTHPILSGTLVGTGVGALGGAAVGALASKSGDTANRTDNAGIGAAVGAGSGAAVGMGIGMLRNHMLYGSY